MTGLLSFITWNCLVPVQGNSFFILIMMNDIFLNSKVKYHIVYKTTNLINGKWYIGKHSTYNLNDGYLGSSKHLKSAIKKYGKHNFKREIICFCDSEEEAYHKEAEFVTMEVVQNPMTYNKMPGGEGSQKRFTDEELKSHKHKWREDNPDYLRKWREDNRERDREINRKWRENHRDEYNAKQRAWYVENKDEINAKRRAKRAENKDEINAKQRAWRLANKLKNSL